MAAKKRQEPVLVEHLLCAGIFTSLFSPQQLLGGGGVLPMRKDRETEAPRENLLRVPAHSVQVGISNLILSDFRSTLFPWWPLLAWWLTIPQPEVPKIPGGGCEIHLVSHRK